MAHIRPLMSAVSYQGAVVFFAHCHSCVANGHKSSRRVGAADADVYFRIPDKKCERGSKKWPVPVSPAKASVSILFWDGKGFARKRRSNDAYRRAYVSYSSKSAALLTFVAPGIRVREGQRETERAIVRSAWAKSGWNVDKQKSIHWHDTTPLVETQCFLIASIERQIGPKSG